MVETVEPLMCATCHHDFSPHEQKGRCALFDCDCTMWIPTPKICEDCGRPGMTHEGGTVLCGDCAILRAKKWQMDRGQRHE